LTSSIIVIHTRNNNFICHAIKNRREIDEGLYHQVVMIMTRSMANDGIGLSNGEDGSNTCINSAVLVV